MGNYLSIGKPKITLNKKYFTMKPDETIFIPLGAIHRIENFFPYKKPVAGKAKILNSLFNVSHGHAVVG